MTGAKYINLISTLTLLLLFSVSTAWGIAPIIRPQLNARSVGMGGVRMTTGLYDENFYNNPARVTANPESKFTLLQLTPEIDNNTLGATSSLQGGLPGYLSKEMGKTIHDRLQTVALAWYLAANEERRVAIGIGILSSAQSDLLLSNTYQSSGDVVGDVGAAVTVGYRVLKDDSLSLGTTLHAGYRMSVNPAISVLDMTTTGSSLNINSIMGSGMLFDFDFGGTYRFFRLGPWEFNAALAMQNILGGNYSPLTSVGSTAGSAPISQPRSLGVGGSVTRAEWGPFTKLTGALELTDMFNNGSGSFFRLVHFGLETHWKRLAVRTGLNQGYVTAGLGLDVYYFTFDLATYGEEMGLNAGQIENRRYLISLGFHI